MKARKSGRQQQQPLFVKNGDTALLNVAGFDVAPLNLSCGEANAVIILVKLEDRGANQWRDDNLICDKDTVLVSMAGVMTLTKRRMHAGDGSIEVSWQDDALPAALSEEHVLQQPQGVRFTLRTFDGQAVHVGSEFYLSDEEGFLRYNASDDTVVIKDVEAGEDPVELPDLIRFRVHGTAEGLQVASPSTQSGSRSRPVSGASRSKSGSRPGSALSSISAADKPRGLQKSQSSTRMSSLMPKPGANIPRSQSDSMLHKDGMREYQQQQDRSRLSTKGSTADGMFYEAEEEHVDAVTRTPFGIGMVLEEDESADIEYKDDSPGNYIRRMDGGNGEYMLQFGQVSLGMILKRDKLRGIVYVCSVMRGSEAESFGVQANDVILQAGDLELRNRHIDAAGWDEFVQYVVVSPRPLTVVIKRVDSIEAEFPIDPEIQHEELRQQKLQSLQETLILPTDKKSQTAQLNLVESDRDVLLDIVIPCINKGVMWNTLTPKRLVLLSDMVLISTDTSGTSKSAQGKSKKKRTQQVEFHAELATCKLDMRVNNCDNRERAFDLIMPTGTLTFVAESIEARTHVTELIFHSICAAVEAQGTNQSLGWRHQIRLGTLHSSVIARQHAKVQELLVSLADTDLVNEQDADGYSPLHYACITRQNKMIQLLLDGGAEVNVPDNDGFTPLHWSALQLESEALRMLGQRIGDVDVLDFSGKTALFYACVHGTDVTGETNLEGVRKCVQALVEMGGDALARDAQGYSILHHLAVSWRHEILEILLQSIGDPDHRATHTKQTALHLACACAPLPQSESETARLQRPKSLVARRAEEQPAPDPHALPYETRDLSAAVKVLLMYGARANLKDNRGETPLVTLVEEAKQAGFPEKMMNGIRQLLVHGARFDDHPAEDTLKRSKSNVKLSDLYEEWKQKPALNLPNVSIIGNDKWSDGHQADPEEPRCLFCEREFNLFRRQHHCRICGLLVCNSCSSKSVKKEDNSVRACDSCYNRLFYEEKRNRHKSRGSADGIARTASSNSQPDDKRGSARKSNTLASDRAALFGDAKSGSDSKLDAKATTGSQAGLAGVHDVLSETRQQFAERGERLNQLSEKTSNMASAAAEFAQMARKLREQQEQQSRWW